MSIRSLLFLGCSLAAALPHLPHLPRQETDDPNSSDPTTPPASITAPTRGDNPFPNGWPQLPSECTDASNPSEACKNALHASDGGVHAFGGTLHHDGSCKVNSADTREGFLETAAWDAQILAHYTSLTTDIHNIEAGRFYIGPDYAGQQQRIKGKL
jgi:hypothetical protein